MFTIKKISQYLNSPHRLQLVLLSAVLSLPLALVASSAWFTVLERKYSFRNLVSAAPYAFFILFGIILFFSEKHFFKIEKHGSQKRLSGNRIAMYFVDFSVLIAVACGLWMTIGSKIIDAPQNNHVVSISPLINSTGEICILEITNKDGVKISENNKNINNVISTDAMDPRMDDCQLFLPKSSKGSLNFSYIGPLDDTLTFLVKSNKEAGKFLVRVNGVKTVVFNLYDEQSGYSLRYLPLNRWARVLVWNLIGIAGLTAFFLVFLMIVTKNSDYFQTLSHQITLSDRFVIILLTVSIILLIWDKVPI